MPDFFEIFRSCTLANEVLKCKPSAPQTLSAHSYYVALQKSRQVMAAEATVKVVNSEAQVLEFKARTNGRWTLLLLCTLSVYFVSCQRLVIIHTLLPHCDIS